jgi:hypothetical protein
LLLSFVVAGAFAPPVARAQTYFEVINAGGACHAYPNQPANGVSYEHFFWMYGPIMFCDLTMTSEWTVSLLGSVAFSAFSSSPLTARLCLHAAGETTTCGPPNSVPGATTVVSSTIVFPPTDVPYDPSGAYLLFTKPFGIASVYQLIPVWQK